MIKTIGLGVFMLVYSAVANSATLVVKNGSLMGATGVDVNGTLYDVQFLDGSCAELFNGCDQLSDFTFSNPLNDDTLLKMAMTALLDQVLVDSPLGAFDSSPALTNGCNVATGCQINTPLFPGGSVDFVAGVGAFNSIDEFRDTITVGNVAYNSIAQFPETDLSVFAVWNQSVVVPVPAAIWLFGSGLLGLIGLCNTRTARSYAAR